MKTFKDYHNEHKTIRSLFRKDIDGLLPIFIRITVNGERIKVSTKRFTPSDKWSDEGNRMKDTSAEARTTNSYLDTLKSKAYDYQQQLIREDELVNAENMRNKILGIDKRSHMLIGIFQQHNDEIKSPYW